MNLTKSMINIYLLRYDVKRKAAQRYEDTAPSRRFPSGYFFDEPNEADIRKISKFAAGLNEHTNAMGLKQELGFRLPDVEGDLKVVYAPCLMKVYHDGRKLKRDGRKGYEVTTVNGEKTYFKLTVDFTLSHIVEYRGRKMKLESPLSTWEYIVGGIPLLLIFAGGLLGVLCGFIGVTYTYSFMRQHRNVPAKIGVAILSTVLCFFVYFLFAGIFTLLFGTVK